MEIKDKKGSENLVADHLSRLQLADDVNKGEKVINERFTDESLMAVEVSVPWFADIVNYLVCGILPYDMSYQ